MNISELKDESKKLSPRQWAMLSAKHSNGMPRDIWEQDQQVVACALKLGIERKALRKLIACDLRIANGMPSLSIRG